jgi:hypothetical protein
VFSGKIETLEINWSRHALVLREKIMNQVMNWNLNCILAKRIGVWKENKVFIDVKWKEDGQRKEIIYCQFHSKTKTEFHYDERTEKEYVFQKIEYFETIYSIKQFICFDERIIQWLESPKIQLCKMNDQRMEGDYRIFLTQMCNNICDYLREE